MGIPFLMGSSRVAQRAGRSKRQAGQSTVEFSLMIPVLFAMLFFGIQLGLYFTTVHYGTYAAFVTARAQQGGFSERYSNVKAVSDLVLTGDVWFTSIVMAESVGGKAAGVTVQLGSFEKLVPFPFITQLMPYLNLETSAFLGPEEWRYEGVEGRSRSLYDNNQQPIRGGF